MQAHVVMRIGRAVRIKPLDLAAVRADAVGAVVVSLGHLPVVHPEAAGHASHDRHRAPPTESWSRPASVGPVVPGYNAETGGTGVMEPSSAAERSLVLQLATPDEVAPVRPHLVAAPAAVDVVV